MTSFSGYIAPGGGLVAGVLTEIPGLDRVPVSGTDAGGGTIMISPGVTIGPFPGPGATLAAFAIFAASTAGAMLYSGSMTSLSVAAGQYVTFPAGAYSVSPGTTPDSTVLTLGGIPLTVAGQPLQVG